MEIKIAETQKEFFGLALLRKNVFVNEQSVDINIEIDDYDQIATHFVVLDDSLQVIGTCRLVNNLEFYKLGRMAIDPLYRHNKLGTDLLLFVEDYVKSTPIQKIVLGAQLHALDFYLKNDYLIISDVFYEANIPHKLMEKNLR